jgi:transposase-like protein
MSEALGAGYPATTLQNCLVHLLRNSLDFANWKERKPLAPRVDAFRRTLHREPCTVNPAP